MIFFTGDIYIYIFNRTQFHVFYCLPWTKKGKKERKKHTHTVGRLVAASVTFCVIQIPFDTEPFLWQDSGGRFSGDDYLDDAGWWWWCRGGWFFSFPPRLLRLVFCMRATILPFCMRIYLGRRRRRRARTNKVCFIPPRGISHLNLYIKSSLTE